MSNLVKAQASKLGQIFGMEASGEELIKVLKETAFKGQVSDSQMMALLVIAGQYKLNPWVNEIYAFPSKGHIVPIVGVDGWSRIINEHPQFDGLDFIQDDESCTAIIYRKDRSHPIKITEFLSECKRNTEPWKVSPKRMLRHKALIQCARLAFGYTGIYEPDEAEKIRDITESATHTVHDKPAQPKAPTPYSFAEFEMNAPKWKALIESGKYTANQIIAGIEAKGRAFTDEQKLTIASYEPIDVGYTVDEETGEITA
jgi:phage recombination protein Bet